MSLPFYLFRKDLTIQYPSAFHIYLNGRKILLCTLCTLYRAKGNFFYSYLNIEQNIISHFLCLALQRDPYRNFLLQYNKYSKNSSCFSHCLSSHQILVCSSSSWKNCTIILSILVCYQEGPNIIVIFGLMTAVSTFQEIPIRKECQSVILLLSEGGYSWFSGR